MAPAIEADMAVKPAHYENDRTVVSQFTSMDDGATRNKRCLILFEPVKGAGYRPPLIIDEH